MNSLRWYSVRNAVGLLTLCGGFLLAGFAQAEEKAAAKPKYPLQVDLPMKNGVAMTEFVFTDKNAWKMMTEGEDRLCLALVGQSKYKPKHRSPLNIAMIQGQQFGDFELEVQLQQTGKEYGHRDMCLFFGIQDPEHFYYCHIATKTDPHAHNIFIVNDSPRLKISDFQTPGFDWGKPGTWHKVRLARNVESGKIAVYMNDMPEPIMTAVDKTFGAGWIGFGSFDDTGLVDDIQIFAPEVTKKKADFFQALELVQ